MKTNHQDVFELHQKFELPITDSPRLLTEDEFGYRLRFLREELGEFVTAHYNGNLPETADALVDLVYVALGTAIMMGLPWQPLWDAVHAANLAKERVTRVEESKRGSLMDLRKPETWAPPNLVEVLAKHHSGMQSLYHQLNRP